MINSRIRLTVVLFLALLLVAVFPILGAAQTEKPALVHSAAGPEVILLAGEGAPGQFVPPPALKSLAPGAADIVVTYDADFPLAAKAAFEYAVVIWESLITSPVVIEVEAKWELMLPAVLGGAQANYYFNGFNNQLIPNTFYPQALANKLHGSDLDETEPDIIARFNSGFSSWYFGTDGSVPIGYYDFATVVLHELAHGLGFIGSMYRDSINEVCGFGLSVPPLPVVYDRFTQDEGTIPLISFTNPSPLLCTKLTAQVYFSATHTVDVYNDRVPLYSPNPWQPGSSYSHLEEIFNNTPNQLMTFSVDPGAATHHPGPVALAMLQDMGWTVPSSVPTPTFTPTPLQNPASSSYLPDAQKNFAAPTPTATLAPGLGLYGTVTQNGVPAAWVPLDLLRIDTGSSTWFKIASTWSQGDGHYNFTGLPSLLADEAYQVTYTNLNNRTDRLFYWATRQLGSYTAGSNVHIGNFDIADLPLTAPADGANLNPPVTFTWTVRPASPTDSYRLVIYDMDYHYLWDSGLLGYSGSYTLTSLPGALATGVEYLWDVRIYALDGAYGICYGVRTLEFTGSGGGMRLEAAPPGWETPALEWAAPDKR